VNADDFEARMRLGECFHALRVPPTAFIIVRVDGRSFSRLTERLTEKPFDSGFHDKMVRTASALLESLQASYVYTESDEISALLPRETGLFDREVEKLVSISAARASATLSLLLGEAVEFDARLWVGGTDDAVVDYFMWRQSDATRCALNGWAYWTLRREGRDARAATEALERASVADKNELLFARGINFNAVPAWQRRGTGLYWETYEKDGFNPKSGEAVRTLRRRTKVDDVLPMKDDYARFVRERIG
jgi:tRNA(His) 5'-end guanylyltransferase